MTGWDYDPWWASDGSGFVFAGEDTVNGDFKERIYFFDIADSSLTVLLEGPLAFSPKLSPDGKSLVFNIGRDIYLMNMETDSIEQLTFLGKCFFPDWSPDGTKIAYDIPEVDQGGVQILYLETRTSKQLFPYSRQPVWFQDGERLLVIDFSTKAHGEIIVIDTTGAKLAQLTHDSTFADKRAIDVSSDGHQICFVQQFDCEMPQLWIMNIDGTGKKRLTSRGAQSCSFSPDGNWILYTYLGDNNGRIWAVKPDGSDKHQMTYRRGW
jgi:Tol biopolymer transport system component